MKIVLGIAAFAAAVALPAASFAATYAYVNTSGEVMSMEAADANTALMSAPSIGAHSGVMLIGSDDDDVVGSTVK